MARAVDQFRASDVTSWGVVAMVCCGLAVLSANVSALVPDSVLAVLHASRLEGSTLNQMRGQLASLQEETQALRRLNSEMLTRFALAERESGDVTRRVGALEVALPNLLEQRPEELDRTAITAGIGDGNALSFETEGGSVVVHQRPLVTGAHPEQAMPTLVQPEPAIGPDRSQFGLALGGVVAPEAAAAAWSGMMATVGTLLVGLGPLLSESEDGTRLVAGPLPSRAQADNVCRLVAAVGVACTTVPFLGSPLPAAPSGGLGG